MVDAQRPLNNWVMGESLGERIKNLRIKIGLTQEELAEKLNITSTHMGYIEQNRRKPSFEMLLRIAGALRVQVKDLIPF